MNLAVLTYQFVSPKPVGIPDEWPAEVRELGEGTTLPGPDWVLMTEVDLINYKATYQAAYDAFKVIFKENQKKSTTYSLTEDRKCPSTMDFNLFGCHKRETFTTGWLTKVELFKDYNPATNEYSNLACKDEYEYFVNVATNLVTHRIETITWYMQDGSVGSVKTITKYYSLEKALNEGIYRRQNLLAAAKKVGLALIQGEYSPGFTNAQHFLKTCEESGHIRLYEQGITTPLKDFVANHVEAYLTQEIKDTLAGILGVV